MSMLTWGKECTDTLIVSSQMLPCRVHNKLKIFFW